MRPSEQNVTFVLYQLVCQVTEDAGGDEPYLWILGFKVDADTITSVGGALPNLGVQVIDGAPASPFPTGPNSLSSPATIPIPPALGTRSFGLRPALLDTGGWFPGLAGVICLLWDQDGFAPSTSEAGFRAFHKAFGPALSAELNNLLSGTYDDALSRDATGNVVAPQASSPLLPVEWRLARLGDPGGRGNAVKAMKDTVTDRIKGPIRDALSDAAGWDEIIDPDDLLGVQAQVYLGDELGAMQDFAMRFTDDEADYTVRGHALASRAHAARLDSIVTAVDRRVDRWIGLWMRVCWYPEKLYTALSFRVTTTTRFELRTLAGAPPVAVRWLLDDTVLNDGDGSVGVTFEAADAYSGPPQDALAGYYHGGSALLRYRSAGPVLDVWNDGGDGAFFGTIRAVYAFAGDPPLLPPGPLTAAGLRARGYELSDEFGVVAVELVMGAEYAADVGRCKRVIHDIDRKHIAVPLGRVPINPGDPPVFRQGVLDRVTTAARVANAVGVEIAAAPLRVRR